VDPIGKMDIKESIPVGNAGEINQVFRMMGLSHHLSNQEMNSLFDRVRDLIEDFSDDRTIHCLAVDHLNKVGITVIGIIEMFVFAYSHFETLDLPLEDMPLKMADPGIEGEMARWRLENGK